MSGFRSFNAGPGVGVSFHTDDGGAPRDRTAGWNQAGFNYCPEGPWADWVKLAHWIIAEDERRSAGAQ